MTQHLHWLLSVLFMAITSLVLADRGLAQESPRQVIPNPTEPSASPTGTTQQGTGTFISDQKVTISDVERERILAEITRSFVSHAASYGFSLEDLSSYLNELKRGE